MKKLDLVLAWVLVVLGFLQCGGVFVHFNRLTNDAVWFFSGGVAIAEAGFLNVIRNGGGRGMARVASIIGNVLLLVVLTSLTILFLMHGHFPANLVVVLSLVLVAAETLFSVA